MVPARTIPTRAALAVLLLLLAGFALAACGGDDESGGDAATGDAAAATAASSDAFPVTIRSALGDAVIEAPPERVVALDFGSADTALALGVTPVAMAEVDYVEGGIQTWTRAALRGAEPELIDVADGIPIERVAAARPDLILASNAFGIEEVFDGLSRIAPVVAFEERLGEDTWQQITENIGAALGRSEEAEQVIDDVSDQVEEARAANPELEGRTISFFNLADQLYVVNDPADFAIEFLADLGFRLTPRVEALPGQLGRAPVSEENYELIDADVVMGTSPAPSDLSRLEQSSVFRLVPAIARDAWVPLPLAPSTSIAFPSPLSIPYALELLVPRLAAAARAARAG